ncbi:MAG: hypothetical protein LBT01_07225 [Spirochaetaceae bacterium]|jgi:hypothetical protein|nr:hypothetical protein [Spirochaetaceae bacterium]
MEHFEVKIKWDETEGEPAMWISECEPLGVFLCEPTLRRLLSENQLAAETMREVDGKSMDFILDFKIEVPKVSEMVA